MAALTTREDQPLPEDLPGPEGELPDVEPPPPSLLQLYSQDVYGGGARPGPTSAKSGGPYADRFRGVGHFPTSKKKPFTF